MTSTTKTVAAGYLGSGAREYLQELSAGFEYSEEYDSKRVKICDSCLGRFYDRTRPRNKVTCSPECKKLRDAAKLREKIEEERRLDPSKRPRLTMIEEHYASHLEYPYWAGREPEEYAWNYETPHGTRVEDIYAAREREQEMGGRRSRNTNVDYYEGNWGNNFGNDY